ncbi:MAG TPA: hypothetical protein VFZ51_04540 [Woeseiaceae bacterium]
MIRLSNSTFRALVISVLVAAGVVSIIATGGGGGGSSGGNGVPPPSGGPTVGITADNAFEVSSAVVQAVGFSFDVAELSGGEVATDTGGAPAVRTGKSVLPLVLKVPVGPVTEPCINDGTVTISGDVADPDTVSVGDELTAIFSDCDDGEGSVVNGEFSFTIAEIEGDIFTDVFLLTMDMTLTDLVITEGTETLSADGDLSLTLDNLDYPTSSLSISGDEFTLGEGGETYSLMTFSHSMVIDGDASQAEASGTLDSSALDGTVDYDTPVTLEAFLGENPHVGEMLVSGADDSEVRIVVVDSTSVVLQTDIDGDGVVDDFEDTTWTALNGDTSAVGGTL